MYVDKYKPATSFETGPNRDGYHIGDTLCGPPYPGPEPPVFDPYNPGVPGPTITKKHVHKHCPPPMDDSQMYVRKKELNEVLKNIGEANIHEETSETGTTVSVGPIAKGTELGKITFSQLVELLFYPTDPSVVENSYVTQVELKNEVESAVESTVKPAVEQAITDADIDTIVQEAVKEATKDIGNSIDGEILGE